MRIDIGGSPFVAGDPLADKVIRNAMTFLLQIGFWDTRVGEHGFVVPVYVGRTITSIPIIWILYQILRTYSRHCFMAMNSEPKELVSMPVCFLDIQKIGVEFK